MTPKATVRSVFVQSHCETIIYHPSIILARRTPFLESTKSSLTQFGKLLIQHQIKNKQTIKAFRNNGKTQSDLQSYCETSRAQPDLAYEFPDWTGPHTQIRRTRLIPEFIFSKILYTK